MSPFQVTLTPEYPDLVESGTHMYITRVDNNNLVSGVNYLNYRLSRKGDLSKVFFAGHGKHPGFWTFNPPLQIDGSFGSDIVISLSSSSGQASVTISGFWD